MQAPTPFAEKNFSIDININKTEIKLSSSENIISLSTELNNKKYRLTISSEELNLKIFLINFHLLKKY